MSSRNSFGTRNCEPSGMSTLSRLLKPVIPSWWPKPPPMRCASGMPMPWPLPPCPAPCICCCASPSWFIAWRSEGTAPAALPPFNLPCASPIELAALQALFEPLQIALRPHARAPHRVAHDRVGLRVLLEVVEVGAQLLDLLQLLLAEVVHLLARGVLPLLDLIAELVGLVENLLL